MENLKTIEDENKKDENSTEDDYVKYRNSIANMLKTIRTSESEFSNATASGVSLAEKESEKYIKAKELHLKDAQVVQEKWAENLNAKQEMAEKMEVVNVIKDYLKNNAPLLVKDPFVGIDTMVISMGKGNLIVRLGYPNSFGSPDFSTISLLDDGTLSSDELNKDNLTNSINNELDLLGIQEKINLRNPDHRNFLRNKIWQSIVNLKFNILALKNINIPVTHLETPLMEQDPNGINNGGENPKELLLDVRRFLIINKIVEDIGCIRVLVDSKNEYRIRKLQEGLIKDNKKLTSFTAKISEEESIVESDTESIIDNDIFKRMYVSKKTLIIEDPILENACWVIKLLEEEQIDSDDENYVMNKTAKYVGKTPDELRSMGAINIIHPKNLAKKYKLSNGKTTSDWEVAFEDKVRSTI